MSGVDLTKEIDLNRELCYWTRPWEPIGNYLNALREAVVELRKYNCERAGTDVNWRMNCNKRIHDLTMRVEALEKSCTCKQPSEPTKEQIEEALRQRIVEEVGKMRKRNPQMLAHWDDVLAAIRGAK